MKFYVYLVFLFNLITNVSGGEITRARSGKSLGDVSIGETFASLAKKGYLADNSRTLLPNSVSFMKKDDTFVRLKNDEVVQIWFDNLDMIRFRGKKLPKSNTPQAFKKFFKGCEEFQGSGGKLIYCESRGIELAFPGASGEVGFSVILPSEVQAIVGKP